MCTRSKVGLTAGLLAHAVTGCWGGGGETAPPTSESTTSITVAPFEMNLAQFPAPVCVALRGLNNVVVSFKTDAKQITAAANELESHMDRKPDGSIDDTEMNTTLRFSVMAAHQAAWADNVPGLQEATREHAITVTGRSLVERCHGTFPELVPGTTTTTALPD